MKIGSLSEYLEALLAVEDYYSSRTPNELLEEFKNIFPLGTPIYDENENYLGDVVSWGISGSHMFTLDLEYGKRGRSVQVKAIKRVLSSVSGIPITRVGVHPIANSWPFEKCSVLAHRIIKPED